MTQAQQYNILKRSTAVKRESKGFNLDSLANSTPIRDLFASYDQVQVRNGNQNLLLQRSTADNAVAPRADVNAAGNLQVLPDVGGKAASFQQRANAARKAATPAWEKYAIPIGIGVAGLVAVVMVIRHG